MCESSDMPDSSPQLILASRSPRRRELLTAAGYRFEVIEPSESAEKGVRTRFAPIVENESDGKKRVLTPFSPFSGESPSQLVARLAYQKAADVIGRLDMGRNEGKVVLACDTIAECDGLVLGKPSDAADARAMLGKLSGREHRVLSGLCLWPIPQGEPHARVAVTSLRMDPLDGDQLNEYIASGGWEGKAGAFGYQDRLGWVHVIEGSETNVVGLPMELLEEMLS